MQKYGCLFTKLVGRSVYLVPSAIHIENVVKKFAAKTVLNRVSLSAGSGQTYGFFGSQWGPVKRLQLEPYAPS
jgi:hypothetical protein